MLTDDLALAGVAVATVDSVGRRPLLLGGVTGMVVSLVGLGVASIQLQGSAAAWTSVAALLAYVGAYQVSFLRCGCGSRPGGTLFQGAGAWGLDLESLACGWGLPDCSGTRLSLHPKPGSCQTHKILVRVQLQITARAPAQGVAQQWQQQNCWPPAQA